MIKTAQIVISPRATAIITLAMAAVVGCSLFAGASTHIPAFIVRVVMVIGVLSLWPRKTTTCHQWELFTPALALLCVLLGQANTDNIALGLQPAVTVIVSIGLFIALVYTEHEYAHRLLILSTGIGVIHAGWAIIQAGAGATRASGGFFNPNNCAALLVPLIIIALHEGLRSPSSQKWIFRFAALVMFLGLAATASRTGFVALAVSGAVLLITQLGKKAIIPTLLLLCAAAAGLIWRQIIIDPSDSYSLSRIAIWRESIALAIENPFGVGLGNYHRAMQAHGVPLPGWVRYPKIATQAHSELLQAWVEIGWLGLITMLSCPFTIGLALLKRYKSGNVIGHDLALFFAFTLPALASTTLHLPLIAGLVSIWAANVFRQTSSLGPATSLRIGNSRISLIGIGCVAGIVALFPITIGHYYSDQARELRGQKKFEQAASAATVASKLNPWSVSNHLLKESLFFFNEGSAYQAAQRVTELASDFPTDPRPINRSVWLLNQTSPNELSPAVKNEMKLKLLEELTRRTPKDALVYSKIAQIYRNNGQLTKAKIPLNRCIELEPHCAQCLLMQAELYFQENSPHKSKEFARMALESHENSPPKSNHRSAKILSLTPHQKTIAVKLAQ